MFLSVRGARTALAAATAAALVLGAPGHAQAPAAPPLLTLDEALRRGLSSAPAIAQARAGVDAERGRLAQARLRPNPEAVFDAENFAGSRELSGFDGAELTFQLEQPIELGGKRSARVAAGRAGVEAAEVRARLARLDLEAAIRRGYAEAAAAQERLALARTEAATADEIFGAVSKLVAAGREPPLREARARVEQATARAAVLTASREYEAARRRLAALSGDGAANFTVDAGSLYRAGSSPAPAAAAPSADVELAGLEAERARAQVRVERAARTPDPRLTGGVRRLEAEGSTAFVAGVALPLPLFNRNGGAVAAATAEAARAEAALAQAEIDARVRAANARGALETARAQADTFGAAVIPAAEEALRVARLGYAAGKFPYIELLEAQRALGSARRQRVDAALEVARASADLDRALGRSLLPE